MEKEEALEKIEEINTIIRSSNKVIFHGNTMIASGLAVLLIPLLAIGVIPLMLKALDFGVWTKQIVSIVFMFATAGMVMWVSKVAKTKFKYKDEHDTKHPLIQKAFSLYKPILVSLFGGVTALVLVKEYQFIWPLVFLNLGVLFQLYGRFSIFAVRAISWFYLALGIGSILISSVKIPMIQFIYLVILGISYILMGILLNKQQKVV